MENSPSELKNLAALEIPRPFKEESNSWSVDARGRKFHPTSINLAL
jgi:hypothetical protein